MFLVGPLFLHSNLNGNDYLQLLEVTVDKILIETIENYYGQSENTVIFQ